MPRRDEAIAKLREAIALADGNLTACAAAARFRLAGLVSDVGEGRTLLEAARAWAAAEGVVNLPRFMDVLVPGFDRPG